MTTTIMVRGVTRQKLGLLKQKYNTGSFDELLTKLADEKLGGEKSLFGAYKDLKPWTKADRGDSKYD